MEDKYIKRLIIIVSICIFVIGGALIFVLTKTQDPNGLLNLGDEGEEISTNRHKVTDSTMYYTVRNCINDYLSTLEKDNPSFYMGDEFDESLQKEYIYSLLNKNYINKNNITMDNVLNTIQLSKEKLVFIPIEMQVTEMEKSDQYIAFGHILDIYNNYYGSMYIIVNLDFNNKTFDIEPIETLYDSIDEIKSSAENNKIEKNYFNTFTVAFIDNESITNEYFLLYKMLSVSKPEEVFNMMSEEYRMKRFETLNNFKNYINDKKDEIETIKISQYLVNYYNKYTEYVAKDQFDNLYIFKVDNDNNFTITLDSYTILTEKYIEEYTESTNQKKVVANINRFFEMINARDYISAYSVLDSEFKNNYFRTVNDFENYIKQILYNYNDVEYTLYDDSISGIFKYKLKIKNKLDNKQQKELTVAMQLKEGTDFVMSFGVN